MSTTLRVWYIASNGDEEHIPVATPDEAAAWITRMAANDLKNDDIVWNAFGLEEQDADGEWSEWYSEDGDDIDDYMNAMSEDAS